MSLLLQFVTVAALAVLLHRMQEIRHRLDTLDRRLRTGDGRPVPRAAPKGSAAQPEPRQGVSVLGRSGRDAARPDPRPAVPRAAAEAERPRDARRGPEESTLAPAILFAPARPAPAVAPARARLDLELRFGRRWAALLGGGLVAFGVALLVRHSIQQGYFPPSVRLAGAALLSLALCAAAEVFRRRGTFATPAEAGLARRAADVPSVLLGTGLSGLFAVSYAAHAVYGYLEAGSAFAAMAGAALAGLAASLAYGPALAVLGCLGAEGVPLLAGGGDTAAGAAYVALVGVAGYATAHRGGWRRLENPLGTVLLLWATLLRDGPAIEHALVALPASAAALGFTALRLRPRAAWTDWRPSRQAVTALALMAGQGLLVVSRLAGATAGDEWPSAAFGFGVLLAAFAFAATATRARAAAPVLAAAVVGAVAQMGTGAAGILWFGSADVFAPDPSEVAILFTLVSAVVLAICAAALHRGSRRSPITGLVGAASAAVLLAAGDAVLRLVGDVDPRILAGIAAVQGATLIAAARPRRGVVPASRHLATAAAASVGVGLLGFASIAAEGGDGSLTTSVLAATGAGAAVLAWIWAMPLFASVAGIAALPVLVRAGLGVVRSVLAAEGGGAALLPFLENTLLPGLVVAGTALLLSRRPGVAAVRDADRRWLGLIGRAMPEPGTGPAASLVLAGTAGGGLLLGALVGIVRFVAFGDPYAPLSVPADIGLACTLALSASLAALRLHRAVPLAILPSAARDLTILALPLSAGALFANPVVTGAPVGALPFLNLLLPAYLLPAVAAWRLARDLARSGLAPWRGPAAAMAIAGLLGYATFAVAQAFQGSVLSLGAVTAAELWTYTAVWLLLGAAVLAYGLRRRMRAVRVAALGIFAATAAKVVFVDLADLTGTARAASVLALGLVLLGVGMAYQRLSAVGERP